MSSQRHFLKDSLVFQVLNWLIKPIWIFLIDRQVQNTLGEAIYGEYLVNFNFTLLFVVMLDIGMHNFQTREVAANRKFLQVGSPGLMWIKILLSALFVILVTAFGLLNNLALFWLLSIGLNQILNSWILFFRSKLAGLQLFRLEAFVSVLDRLISILGIALFLFSQRFYPYFNIKLFILLQTLALGLALLFVILICYQKGALHGVAFPGKERMLRLFKTNLPYAALTLLMTFYTRLDVILIKQLSEKGYEMVGIYAHSFRFLDAASMYVMLFTGMLLPVFAKQLAQKTDFNPLLRLVLKLVWIPGLALIAIAVYRGQEVMGKLYRITVLEEVLYSGEVFKWLMISYIPYSASLVLGALLTAGGHLAELIRSTAIALVALVVASVVLIPEYGALGAAQSVCITQCVVLIQFAILAHQHHAIFNKDLMRLTMKLIPMFIILIVFAQQIENNFNFSLLMFIALVGVVEIILVFLGRVITINQIKNLFKHKV